MQLLISTDHLLTKSYKDPVPCRCLQCKQTFTIRATRAKSILKQQKLGKVTDTADFCSQKCHYTYKHTGVTVNCVNCGALTYVQQKLYINSRNRFCSKTCRTTFCNAHKSYGYRRSKLEIYIENRLKQEFPTLPIAFNDTSAINIELDIYLPSLRLAFELNGIFHYEPIFKEGTLERTQERDQRKILECSIKDIELCVINTTAQKYFKEATAEPFYSIIKTLITKNLNRQYCSEMVHATGNAPA